MVPLYPARLSDLRPGDFVKVDCAACGHVALLTTKTLLMGGLSPAAKVLDLKGRLRCRGCGRKGRVVVSVKWRGQGAVSGWPAILMSAKNRPGRSRLESSGEGPARPASPFV